MKIVTWNINSVRLRLALLKKLVIDHQPDIICLQEIKVENDLFPLQMIQMLGYNYLYYQGQKSYHGVAILSKIAAESSFSLEFYNGDKRHIAVQVGGYEIHNFYVPAGGDIACIVENAKFKHKIEYIGLVQKWFAENRSRDNKIILTGDLNIAPHEHDVWSSNQLKNVVSHTEIERSLLISLQRSIDFVDSGRYFVPMDEKLYTWWSYRNIDWEKSNRGRRLDHIWVSKNLQNLMKSIYILKEARNWLRPSDHIPYMLELYE